MRIAVVCLKGLVFKKNAEAQRRRGAEEDGADEGFVWGFGIVLRGLGVSLGDCKLFFMLRIGYLLFVGFWGESGGMEVGF
jgi:hypothetical protein